VTTLDLFAYQYLKLKIAGKEKIDYLTLENSLVETNSLSAFLLADLRLNG
jgi:hypothetical protein